MGQVRGGACRARGRAWRQQEMRPCGNDLPSWGDGPGLHQEPRGVLVGFKQGS